MNSSSVGEAGSSGVFVPQYIPKREVALNTLKKDIYIIYLFKQIEPVCPCSANLGVLRFRIGAQEVTLL